MKKGRKLKSLKVEIYRNAEGNGYEVYVKGDRMLEDGSILYALKYDEGVNYLEKYLPLQEKIKGGNDGKRKN